MLIRKTENYKVGVCSITQWVGLERKNQFDEGEIIEVSQEELDSMQVNSDWFEEEVLNG